MMRHPILRPLSRDHHFTLIHAKRLSEAAADSASADEAASAVAALRSHWPEALDHFAAEEQHLAPAASEPLRARLQEEHARLRQLAEALLSEATPSKETMRELGEALDAHVRFEEHELFPHVEAALGEDGLKAIEAAMNDLEARRDRGQAKPQ